MYPKDFPNLVADQSNRTYLDNSSDTLKKIWSSLAGGKKRDVKPGSNIKAYNTNEDWYLACKAYQKLSSQDGKINRRPFFDSSIFSDFFTDTKSEE